MSTENDVMDIFERANPVPDAEFVTVEPDARRFLSELVDDDRLVLELDSVRNHRIGGRRRWLLPAVAAVALPLAVVGLFISTQRDVDTPAPADTAPHATDVATTPPTTTADEITGDVASPTDVVDRFFSAYEVGDIATIATLLADDIVLIDTYDGTDFGGGLVSSSWPGSSPVPSPVDYLSSRIEQGETAADVSCEMQGGVAACTYTLPIEAGGSLVNVPVRAELTVIGGRIIELEQRLGDNTTDENYAVDDLIFRTYPELWDDVFGATSTATDAALQVRRRAAWLGRTLAECPYSHCLSPKVPAVEKSIDNSQLVSALGGERWAYRDPGGYFNRCEVFSPALLDLSPDPFGSTLGPRLEPLEPGLPTLRIEAPMAASPIQTDVMLGWITDAVAECHPDAEPLPADSAAHGFIVEDEFAMFAVTHPRGGIVWITMTEGGVTIDLINELAAIAQQHLDDALDESSSTD